MRWIFLNEFAFNMGKIRLFALSFKKFLVKYADASSLKLNIYLSYRYSPPAYLEEYFKGGMGFKTNHLGWIELALF